jgi:hypothetical protein
MSGQQINDSTFSVAGLPNWTLGAGWIDGTGKATKNADGLGTLYPSSAGTPYVDMGVGAGYTVTYTVLDYTVGSVTASMGGQSDAARSANGTYVWNVTPTAFTGALDVGTTLKFTPTNTARLSIDDVTIAGTCGKTASSNTAVGGGALYMACGGTVNNVGVGGGALRQHTTGSWNTCTGTEACAFNGTGQKNAALGFRALRDGNAGSSNIALGYYAGKYETGSFKLFIDSIDRLTEAASRTESLVYGVMDATPANQTFTVNGTSVALHGFKERGYTAKLGEWTTPAHNAANYIGNGAMTWTVAAGDVATYAYTLIGKTMTVSFWIRLTSVGGVPNSTLRIAVPDSRLPAKTMYGTYVYNDNAAGEVLWHFRVVAGTGWIDLAKTSGNWTASVDQTEVKGQITFEIQ